MVHLGRCEGVYKKSSSIDKRRIFLRDGEISGIKMKTKVYYNAKVLSSNQVMG